MWVRFFRVILESKHNKQPTIQKSPHFGTCKSGLGWASRFPVPLSQEIGQNDVSLLCFCSPNAALENSLLYRQSRLIVSPAPSYNKPEDPSSAADAPGPTSTSRGGSEKTQRTRRKGRTALNCSFHTFSPTSPFRFDSIRFDLI